ncbi:MAG: CU044_2847 family protein [Candidatus Methanoperedens sp.]|nr:CU044_2847 family protein [Candidatus Methanoperedens sp.]
MSTFTIDKNAPVFVELTPRPGLKQVSAATPEDIAEKSGKALDSSMNTIHHMATRVSSMIDALVDQPNQVDVEFGLKFDTEMGAIIAKAGMEASINVKLTWERKVKP